MSEKINIIGGGITGLLLAYSESKKGNIVTLYEKNQNFGGVLSTKITEEGLVETAANGILLTKELQELCDTIGIKPIKANPSASRRYFWKNKKLYRIPISFLDFLNLISKVLFLKIKLKSNETFWDWSQRTLGASVTRYIIEPAIGGIFGTRLKNLNVNVVFPHWDFSGNVTVFQNLKQRKKSKTLGTYSFEWGMGEFVIALKNYLESKIVFKTNYEFKSNENLFGLEGKIYFALPLHKVIDLFKAELKTSSEIRLLSLTSITRFSKEKLTKKSCFGILFPENEGITAYGVLSNSDLFPNRVNENYPLSHNLYSETWIYPNDLNPNNDKDKWIQILEKDRGYVNSKNTKAVSMYITTWKNVFPAYNSNLEKLNQELDILETNSQSTKNPLRFFGNYRRGIGIKSIFESTIAEKLSP